MKRYEQKNIEVKKDQKLEQPTYRSPEMFVVGKAKRLVASDMTGQRYDVEGRWRPY